MKRAFDLLLLVAALVVLVPVMAVVALAVKLESPGPVFFRQQRVGKEGTRFTVYKFRNHAGLGL